MAAEVWRSDGYGGDQRLVPMPKLIHIYLAKWNYLRTFEPSCHFDSSSVHNLGFRFSDRIIPMPRTSYSSKSETGAAQQIGSKVQNGNRERPAGWGFAKTLQR